MSRGYIQNLCREKDGNYVIQCKKHCKLKYVITFVHCLLKINFQTVLAVFHGSTESNYKCFFYHIFATEYTYC